MLFESIVKRPDNVLNWIEGWPLGFWGRLTFVLDLGFQVRFRCSQSNFHRVQASGMGAHVGLSFRYYLDVGVYWG